MRYIISYDIPCNRRRTRIARKLEAHGVRVQYSVFECDLSHAQFKRLRQDLEYILELAEDNLRIYRLCGDCAHVIERVGVQGLFENPASPCYLVV